MEWESPFLSSNKLLKNCILKFLRGFVLLYNFPFAKLLPVISLDQGILFKISGTNRQERSLFEFDTDLAELLENMFVWILGKPNKCFIYHATVELTTPSWDLIKLIGAWETERSSINSFVRVRQHRKIGQRKNWQKQQKGFFVPFSKPFLISYCKFVLIWQSLNKIISK